MKQLKDMELSELLAMVRDKSDPAFSELVDRYTPMLRKAASSFVSPTFSESEALSEACVALHRAALSYDASRAEVTFGLYARICAYRHLCDISDRELRRVDVLDVDVNALSVRSGVESALIRREMMDNFMKRARDILSDYEYRVFRLHIQGYSTACIAEMLGKDIKSVSNAKSRMLARLRRESELFSGI